MDGKKILGLILFLLASTSVFAQTSIVRQLQKLVASDRASTASFGEKIAMDGNIAIIGADGEKKDANGANSINGAGAAYIFEKDAAGVWQQVQKLVPSDRAAGDTFGSSVSVSGDYVVVGAIAETEDENGLNTLTGAGAAYVFERNGMGVWTEVQKIVASDREASDQFGNTVAISGDYLAVGAQSEDHDASGANFLSSSGSVYIFERDGAGTWNQVQKVVASDRAFGDLFGYHISLSGDDLLVGARSHAYDVNGANALNLAGAAYIFERNGAGVWNQSQKIVATDRTSGATFGWSVAISADYLVVGARGERYDENGANEISGAGAAYVFERDGMGNWVQVKKIVDDLLRSSSDFFGSSVAIAGDYIAVGAFSEDEDATGTNTLSAAGIANLYKRDALGVWNLEKRLVPSVRAASDFFGGAVAVSGNDVFVGAVNEDEDALDANTMNNSGSAYYFEARSYDIVYDGTSWQGGSGAAGEPTTADGTKTVFVDGLVTLVADATIQDLVVSSSGRVTLDATAKTVLRVNGTTTIEGDRLLRINANSTGMAQFINTGDIIYRNNGTIRVQLYIPGGPSYFDYHYIGSPIKDLTYTFNVDDLYRFDETIVTWQHQNDFSVLESGRGYAYRHASAKKRSFIGELHTGTISTPVTATNHSGNPFESMNLVSNPYPSSLDAAAFVNGNTNVSPSLYFWKVDEYVAYNTNLGGGTGDAFNGHIAPGQAFFINSSVSQNVQFTNAMRTGSYNTFYRKASYPHIRLSVTGVQQANSTEILLAAKEEATLAEDVFDTKRLPTGKGLSLSSMIADASYVIQTVPKLNNGTEIVLDLYSEQADIVTFDLTEIEEIDGPVFLLDTWNGTKTDIRQELYETEVSGEKEEGRFVLRFGQSSTTDTTLSFNIVNGKLVTENAIHISSVRVVGMDGKLLLESNTAMIDGWDALATGVYLIELVAEEGYAVKKHLKAK